MAKIRENGAEQPYIKAGIFKIRIPLIHYKWEWSEAFQGILMCATCLGAIPVLTDVLGVSFEIAWSMVIINGLLYNLHSLLGDPVVPGWITPSIPLTTAYLVDNYAIGVERTQALIALQLLLSLVFLVLGATGGAGKIMKKVPNSIKGGIILGAGLSAIIGEIKLDGGRFNVYPVAITIGTLVAFYLLFSDTFYKLKQKNKTAYMIGKFGMLPAIIVAIIAGPLTGELPVPQVELGSIIKIPDFAGIVNNVSVFGVGFPSLDLFIAAIPTVIMIYIIAFGDFVTSEALIGEADEIRKDEKIDFNPNRSNIVSGIRNLIEGSFTPYVPLCGPLWSAVTAAVATRYKDGREAMDSIFSGVGTFRWVTFISVALVPVVTLVQPVLPVALSLTLLVQGFVCVRLAMDTVKTETEKGVAGVMATILAIKGAAWGLAVGIILHVLLIASKKGKDIVSTEGEVEV